MQSRCARFPVAGLGPRCSVSIRLRCRIPSPRCQVRGTWNPVPGDCLRKARTRGVQDWCHPNRGGTSLSRGPSPAATAGTTGPPPRDRRLPPTPTGLDVRPPRRRLRPCAQRPSRPTERRHPPCKPRATRVRSPYGAETPWMPSSPVSTQLDILSGSFDIPTLLFLARFPSLPSLPTPPCV